MRRRQSARSVLVELVLVAIVLVGGHVWLTNGGPAWLGERLADVFPVRTR